VRRAAVGLFVVALAAGVMSAASALPPPPRPKAIASYCSRTGDICYGVLNRGGAVYFQLTTASLYFARYRLCVRPPGEARRCRLYAVRRTGSTWTSSVRFAGNFHYTGPGIYRATWLRSGVPLGPTLRFRLPLG
jgi:hypothetical protein